MIRKVGPHKYVLRSSSGKTLGTHTTKAAARAQETAINMSKARAAGHHVPAAPKR